MSSRKREDTETFEQYKENLRKEGKDLKIYLKGRVFYPYCNKPYRRNENNG